MSRINIGSFSIDTPSEWSLTTLILSGPVVEDKMSKGMLTTKQSRPFQQNIIATMEPVSSGETAQSYVMRQLDGLRNAGVQRNETAKPETLKLENGQDGYLTEQSVVGPSGERVRQLQLVSIKDGVAHTIIASNLDGDAYAKSKAEFRKMLISFL
jgi:hypothetical protein